MKTCQLIKSDITAKAEWLYGSSSGRHRIKALLTDGSAAMILYRLMQAAQRHRWSWLAMIFNKLNAICCQCIIGRQAAFGERLVLIHSQGIVINQAVQGGNDIKIEHQVTIGASRNQSPQLGNGIFIGAGAKIIGGVTIGDHAKIGANAVVTHDVPPGRTAVGVPASLLPVNGDNA